jgi:hypothetical protein
MVIASPKRVVREFNKHFSTLSSNSTIRMNDVCKSYVFRQFKSMKISVSRKFEFIHIVPNQVESLLSTLEIKSAPGVSDIPTKILKHCKSIIAPILAGIFNSCIDQAKFPIEWKTSKTHPLYKNKGDRFDVNSYRGIAILPPVAKIFERILHILHCEVTRLLGRAICAIAHVLY